MGEALAIRWLTFIGCFNPEPRQPSIGGSAVTGQVNAPLFQAYSLHYYSFARANWRLSLPLFPSHEPHYWSTSPFLKHLLGAPYTR